MANYLLDTNYLILLADPKVEEERKQEILRDFKAKLEDKETRLFLTPLIRYEVLRGVDWDDVERLKNLKNVLRGFQTIDIDDDIADLARNLFRLDRSNQAQGSQKKIEKYQFDIFHFATAKENNLQLLSLDRDMNAMNSLYQQYQESLLTD
ncbi:PIN domain-containing protein [Pelistega suis]|uniref:PIN domain-containing protein n=1 Tax=Pelistega suis TaxID=1631957 RepID=UPI00211BD8AF|nr:PIN domain-containing protein [Pelistega suis]MCQ9329599.1 PIN domain-containing protein [Pelistega suis]